MSNLLQEIEAQISGAKTATAKQNVGIVREIGDGVAKIEGLTDTMLNEMLDLFETDNGRFPTQDEGLQVLLEQPAGLPNWHRYVDKVPTDPWGNPYRYTIPSQDPQHRDYDLSSAGPNGKIETAFNIAKSSSVSPANDDILYRIK